MVIVHMGLPKTGTTSLQVAMTRNSTLLASAGVNYVRAAPAVNANDWFKHLRPRHLRKISQQEIEQRVQQTRDTVLSNIAADGTTMLSAEGLYSINPELIARIFAGHECRFVAYIRDELNFLASSYAQVVHASPTPPMLADFMEARSANHLGKFLKKSCDALGDKFVPRIFNSEQLKGGDIVEDFFCHFFPSLNVDLDLSDKTDKNPSLTDEVIAFKLKLAAEQPQMVSRTPGRYAALVSLSKYFGQPFRLPRDPYEELVAFYHESQKQWAYDFFGRASVFEYHDYPFTDRVLDDVLPERLFVKMLRTYEELLVQD